MAGRSRSRVPDALTHGLTIGGGSIVDPLPSPGRAQRPRWVRVANALRDEDPSVRALASVQDAGIACIDAPTLEARAGVAKAKSAMGQALKKGQIIEVGESRWVDANALPALEREALASGDPSRERLAFERVSTRRRHRIDEYGVRDDARQRGSRGVEIDDAFGVGVGVVGWDSPRIRHHLVFIDRPVALARDGRARTGADDTLVDIFERASRARGRAFASSTHRRHDVTDSFMHAFIGAFIIKPSITRRRGRQMRP